MFSTGDLKSGEDSSMKTRRFLLVMEENQLLTSSRSWSCVCYRGELWSVLVFTCACMPAACSLSVCACSFHSAAWTSSWSGESTHKHVTFFFMDSSCSFIAKHFFVLSIASLSNYSDRDNTVSPTDY